MNPPRTRATIGRRNSTGRSLLAGSRERSPTRHDLYEWCVQTPTMQARFLSAVHGGSTRALCEDFCGPASIARAWILLGGGRTGAGVDRDPEPLTHARLRAREQGIQDEALALHERDILDADARADVIAAFNFAVCELRERAALVAYLRSARARLEPGGVFAADVYGGSDAYARGETVRAVRTPIGEVIYTWEQRRADPLTGRVENAMHFRLPGGEVWRDAFVYDWRLWSVPELRDAMKEAGFTSTEVHVSYGGAIDGEGNPVPVAADEWEEIDENFVAFVIGRSV